MNRDAKRVPLRKRLLLAAAMVAVGGLAWFCMGRIVVAITDSVEHRFFIVLEKGTIRHADRGDYVLFDLLAVLPDGEAERSVRETIARYGNRPAVKRVACAPGNRLVSKGKDYYCDGAFIGTAKDVSSTGATTMAFRYDGRVPEGCLFVTGSNRDSYDSRYFGFLGMDHVKARLVGIF